MNRPHGRIVHEAFLVSIFLKGLIATMEIIGAVLVYLPRVVQPLRRTVTVLSQHELIEDPNDPIALRLKDVASSFSTQTQHFVALYLLIHGVVKLGLVIALWRRRLWAYPAAIVAFILFLAYQLYRYALAPSLGLLVLSGFDVIVIVLTWLEYRRMRSNRAANA